MMEKNKKAGAFIDRRIGESRQMEMTEEERMLARLVRERSRRSKKQEKYSLNDDDNGGGLTLTHRGKVIDDSYTGKFDADDVILSDDEERYGGQLERADTELHFGGGAFDSARRREKANNPYGPSSGVKNESIGDRYRSRKEELDDLIMRKKYEKAEKAKSKEDQVETFEGMDAQFKELASLLQFRDKDRDRKEKAEARRAGTLSTEDKEMEDWDKEMKQYLFDRKVKATNRTKTPEEIAKEEAERLHELETKRLARMNGDFEKDDLSDISEDDGDSKKKARRKTVATISRKKKVRNPDELDSDDEEDEELETRFTADGLVYVDKNGSVVKKHGENDLDNDEKDSIGTDDGSSETSDDSIGGSDDDASVAESSDGLSSGEESELETDNVTIPVGTNIKGKYRADEQYEGKGKWYKGKIMKVSVDKKSGNTRYDVEYDDGDIEKNVKPENVRKQKKSRTEIEREEHEKTETMKLKAKRQKAKDKARTEIPYIFEVPTTLEALHEMIGTYAATGADASLIIERIHAGNSVRLDKRNKEKMQNFFDVLLRRFIGVGDALYKSGDGEIGLGRYSQLNSLTSTLYSMAQDSQESAGAVFGRRIGIFQNALAKRLRDAEFVGHEDEFTAWPSTGTLLLLRSVGHVFPMTDQRHVVCTPTLILLGQILGQTQVRSLNDLVKGLFCAGLMIEYTKDARRFPTEALAFLASALSLYSENASEACKDCPMPSFAKFIDLDQLREQSIQFCSNNSSSIKESDLVCSLERDKMKGGNTPLATFLSMLRLVEKSVEYFAGALNTAENEAFSQISCGLLRLSPKHKKNKLPELLAKRIAKTAMIVSKRAVVKNARMPLLRRSSAKASELAIQSLAPRMEDPDKYAMAKDKNKTREQADRDKMRREYRREHKAVSRELRLDAAFIESERRKEKDLKDSKTRAARNKNFAWLEQEQATMNQQVAQGGGLLKGGGIGAARSKAASGKVGIKKGGKF